MIKEFYKVKKIFLIFLSGFIIFYLSGCDWLMEIYGIKKRNPSSSKQSQPAAEKLAVPEIKDENLAKFLLKPDRKPVEISRDPFKPLITVKASVKKEEVHVDIVLLGIVKLNNNYTVILRSKSKKGIFKVGDDIEGFKVAEITQNHVILNNGEKNLKLERKN